MTAAEARELSKERSRVLVELDAKIYEDIMKVILKRIGEDESHNVTYYASIPTRVKNRLEVEGYKVTYASHRNEYQYEISWKDESI